MTVLFWASVGCGRLLPTSWPRTRDTARTRCAGSSGPEPRGLANVQAAAARKRTLKATDQVQNRDLPGRRPGCAAPGTAGRTGDGAGGRCGSRTTTGTGNVGNRLAAP